jgi:hypothetical protein
VRRPLPPLLCLVATLAASATTLPASAQGTTLDRARSAEDAVRALGSSISAVAQDNGTTADTLRDRLRSDSALWVDPDGRLFYIDPAPLEAEPIATSTTTPAGAPDSREEVLALSSLPGADRTVHLDVDGFGGEYGGTVGGAWNKRTYTGGDGVAEPYSLDADMAFSTQEIADIYSIWQRVAEDFAPFDINVTTQTPADASIDRSGPGDTVYGTRVAITSTKQSCGCGGVAYVGVFDHDGSNGWTHGYYQPAFVYNRGAKYAAEAASHEAGHNLGLNHDGTKEHDGVAASGYYTGHGDWAPIMGVGYYEPITQWSKGEYAWANNPEDDFAVAAANGGPLRADADGETALGLDGTPVSGAIGTGDAGDVFTLAAPGPDATSVTISVQPALVSPNLDLHVTLATDTADPLSAAYNADVAGGLGATLTATLDPGTPYTVSVKGTDRGDPLLDGYSPYGSVGSYVVTATTGPLALATPVAPGGPTATASSGSVSVSWADVSSDETSVELQRWKLVDGTFAPAGTVLLAADRTAHVDSPGSGTWQYTVRALNSAGPSEPSPVSNTVTLSTSKPRGNK